MTEKSEDAEIIRESKERINPVGKIIAVVGAAGSGKSYLTERLASHFQADSFFEEDGGGFPERIKENFQNRSRLLETIIWFRNQQIRKMLDAARLRDEGKYVIMDTFWLTNQLHIAPYLDDEFEEGIALELAGLDRQTLPWPDVIIYLDSTEKSMRDYMKKRFGARYWEQREDFVRLMLGVQEEHKKFFAENSQMENLIVIEREKVDFERESDFSKLINTLEEKGVKEPTSTSAIPTEDAKSD